MSEIQPPKPLPLRVVGWMSLPWRHWMYIAGTLLFGLFFMTLAPFPFMVRLVVLFVPFIISMVLAMPYGGLHLDEWIMLAFRYRLRPATRPSNHDDLKGHTPEELEHLLKDALQQEEAERAAVPPPAMPSVEENGWPPTGAWPTGSPKTAQATSAPAHIYLAATHGVLRRRYAGLPEMAPEGMPAGVTLPPRPPAALPAQPGGGMPVLQPTTPPAPLFPTPEAQGSTMPPPVGTPAPVPRPISRPVPPPSREDQFLLDQPPSRKAPPRIKKGKRWW